MREASDLILAEHRVPDHSFLSALSFSRPSVPRALTRSSVLLLQSMSSPHYGVPVLCT